MPILTYFWSNLGIFIVGCQDYTIYYAGLSVGTAAGIIFDPKNDDKTLTGDKWIKIEDQEILSALIGWIQTYIQFDPRLWRIVGPDDQFYGYLFFALGHVVIKSVDDTTMYVYNLRHLFILRMSKDFGRKNLDPAR